MSNITDENSLKAWLLGKPLEYSTILVARIALRVTPLLVKALCEEGPSDRDFFILPFFRAVSVVSFLGARPMHMADLQNSAHHASTVINKARKEISDRYDSIQIDIIEYREIMDTDLGAALFIEDRENDAKAFVIAGDAINTAEQAVQAIVDAVDAAKGIAGSDAVHEAVVSAVSASIKAVDGVNGNTLVDDSWSMFDEEEGDSSESPDHPEIAGHISGLWGAVSLDGEFLSPDNSRETQAPDSLVTRLSEMALWPGGIPVWASRHWSEFKSSLPDDEEWQVWTDWYEARLKDQPIDEVLEYNRINIKKKDWDKGPAHINEMVIRVIRDRNDPMITAIAHGLEELDSFKELIDLGKYMDRIKNALPDDPSLAIGETKDMLETTMKTILARQGHEVPANITFPDLLNDCLSKLGLRQMSRPATEDEKRLRTIVSSAQKMITASNELRNRVGTGHGRVAGENMNITEADASLVASTGMILCAWLLRHELN